MASLSSGPLYFHDDDDDDGHDDDWWLMMMMMMTSVLSSFMLIIQNAIFSPFMWEAKLEIYVTDIRGLDV